MSRASLSEGPGAHRAASVSASTARSEVVRPGHASEPRLQEALKALEEYTVFVKVLGSWPLAPME